MSKYIAAAALFVCASAKAGTALNTVQHDNAEVTTIPWDIIGTYAADSRKGVKFIKPVKDCLATDSLLADDDYLLQLRNCHQKRKGWLKI